MRWLASSALLMLAGCGGGPIALSIAGLSSAQNATGVSIQLHNTDRSCEAIRAVTVTTRGILNGVHGTTAAVTGDVIELEPLSGIRAGFYTVVAVAYDDSAPRAYACESNIEITDGETTPLTLTLTPLEP